MDDNILVLLHYGYAVVFILVLIDQLGFPLPLLPVLLAAGALAEAGQFDLTVVILLTSAGSFMSTLVWYELGRRWGRVALGRLCRLLGRSDGWVRRTEAAFFQRGNSALLLSRFVPGLNAVAAPAAGMFGMSRVIFGLLNVCGAVLWAGCFVGLGYLFSHELERVLDWALRLGVWLGVLVGVGAVAWVVFSHLWRYIRLLWGSQIGPMMVND